MGNSSSSRNGAEGGGVSRKGVSGGSASSTVLKHLENAHKSRILQLKGSGLKKVPEQVAEVANILRNLDVSQNKIREVPMFIGSFVDLKQLHLSDNSIECLPDEIGMLRKLEVLNVSNNKLRDLPESLVGCGSLKNLILSKNQLTKFPVVICHLRELDLLDISHNRITSLPDEISSMTASELNANQNQLQSLNSRALVQCDRLKIVRVEENCLPKDAFDPCLLQDSNIALFSYAGNLFQDKDFQNLHGYEAYQQRYTATRRKM